ncbi:MAG: ABC transporter substrate-binding protein [Firmicutes bacterium]|uniref:ABC transporter substrate-binding protein n=1 Tax=Candidatus Alloenteromonas pullistercoris TaxID=2840785 RepID=A0A9D9GV94_9FIRM|nr:ABC transporter substrate-binding protein [Candidatus Enteromonas pullistercoris]
MKKTLLILALGALASSCNNAVSSSSIEGQITLTDALGRNVTLVPGEAERIVCIGAGALRLYSYIGDQDRLAGVERIEVDPGEDGKFGYLNSPYALRPYQKVFGSNWADLPSCGMGGPRAQVVETEAIALCIPDLIISAYDQDKQGMDDLQTLLGVPVLTLSYGETEAFDEALINSLDTLGKALGKEERANELISYINGIEEDLTSRASQIEEGSEVTAYLAGQARYGLRSFESSTAQYAIFDAVGVINPLDEMGLVGYQGSVNLENLIVPSPDKIYLDASSLAMLKADFQIEEKKEAIEAIDAVKNNEVYLSMPYNSYYTNLEIAYCDAYWTGVTAYPELYSDIDLEEKCNEITNMFLGVDFYSNPTRQDDISDVYYGGFAKLEVPLSDFLDQYVA